jgi:hypothetical protein
MIWPEFAADAILSRRCAPKERQPAPLAGRNTAAIRRNKQAARWQRRRTALIERAISPELAFPPFIVHSLWAEHCRPARTEKAMSAGKARFAYPLPLLCLLLCFTPAKLSAQSAAIPEGGYSHPYKFSTNWFLDRIPTWTKLLKDFKGKPDVNYLEVGTLEGRSALWVLENILTHPSSRITLIDTFTENNYETLTSNINLSGQAARFKILGGYSTDKLKELPSNSIDLAYIDGSGKGTVMLSDLTSTWHLLKLNGIVMISRYQLDDHLRKVLDLKVGDPGPQETIDTVLKFYKPYIKVLAYEPNQVIFQKVRQ